MHSIRSNNIQERKQFHYYLPIIPLLSILLCPVLWFCSSRDTDSKADSLGLWYVHHVSCPAYVGIIIQLECNSAVFQSLL